MAIPFGFTGVFSMPPFRIYSKQNKTFSDSTVYCVETSLHLADKSPFWKAGKDGEGAYSLHTTIPSRDFFLETDSFLSGHEHDAWRRIYSFLSGLPRIFHQRISGTRQFKVVSGFHDEYAREMWKTHFRGYWDGKEKNWVIRVPRYLTVDELDMALRIFGTTRKRFILNGSIPEGLSKTLCAHQAEAFERVRMAGSDGRKAFLIAHGMGLGKTLMSIALLRAFCDNGGRGGVAFVLKRNLCNWYDTAKACGLKPVIYHKSIPKKYASPDIDTDIEDADLIISTPDFLLHDKKRILSVLGQNRDRMFFVDESSNYRNLDIQISKCALLFALSSVFTLFLSGTPIVESIQDMESSILLGDPLYYPQREFEKNHVRRTEKVLYIPSQKKYISREDVRYVNAKLFAERVAPFYHHYDDSSISISAVYSKHLVLPNQKEEWVKIDVDDTFENHICARLEKEYAKYYNTSLKNVDIEKAVAEFGEGARRKNKTGTLLLFEQMALNSPLQLVSSTSEAPYLQAVVPEIVSHFKGIPPKTPQSAKEQKVLDIASTYAESGHLLIFTFFQQTAERLHDFLQTNFPDQNIFLLSGGSGVSRVQSVAQALQDAGHGILVCTDAMAFGIDDLHFMSSMIHFDLPWTNIELDQRTKRICRLGTTGEKHIYYFLSNAPIEQKKKRTISVKKDASDGVFGLLSSKDNPPLEKESKIQNVETNLEFSGEELGMSL